MEIVMEFVPSIIPNENSDGIKKIKKKSLIIS
jgi:hypothetical protein